MPLSYVLKNLNAFGEEARKLLEAAAKVELTLAEEQRALAETIRRVYAGMVRGTAPRRSGKLIGSIQGQVKRGPTGGLLVSFTGTDYTRYVIEGTGLYHVPDAHGLIRPKSAQALRFEVGGQVLYRKSVRGQHPNDFNVRAWQRSQPAIKAALALLGHKIAVSFNP